VANWLFYNGVGMADVQHRQYAPDFYIPAADTYLEHWALDENGQPPSFVGYLEGVKWKRELHKAQGTKLLETTMASDGPSFDTRCSSLYADQSNTDHPAARRSCLILTGTLPA
jgi:DNA helicase-4